MLRATSFSLLLLVGLSAACAKKETIQSSGSLLGGTATPKEDQEEEQKGRGMRDGDITQGKGTGLPDSRRMPR